MTYREDPAMASRLPLLVAFNGTLRALEPATGQELWALKLDGLVLRFVFDENRVFCASNSGLACLDHRTGAIEWQVVTTFAGRCTLVLQNGLLFVGRFGELECFTCSGEKLWEKPFKGEGYGHMAIGFPGNFVQADMGQ